MKAIILAIIIIAIVWFLVGKWIWLGFRFGWNYQDGLPDYSDVEVDGYQTDSEKRNDDLC